MIAVTFVEQSLSKVCDVLKDSPKNAPKTYPGDISRMKSDKKQTT